jgi:glycosyltransferase involved in cell wall biosynthesis
MVLGNAGNAGSELYALDLANRLRKLYKVKIDFVYFRNGPMVQKCREYGYETNLINKNYILSLYNLVKTKQYSVIHAHQPLAKYVCSMCNLLLGLFFYPSLPIFYITVHTAPIGLYNFYNIGGRSIMAIVAYLRTYIIQMFAMACANKVFLVSNHQIRFYPCIFKKKMMVTFNHLPLEVENFYSTKFDCDSESFLYCGGGDPNKGFDTMKELALNLVNVHFIFLGRYSTDDLIFLKKKNISVIGQVESKTVWNYMSNVKALIMPSKYETFGRVALEAAFVGCPVILSKIGGLVEVLSEEDALFCDPYDTETFIHAIRFAKENVDIVNRKAIAAKQKIKEKFKFESAARELLIEFDKVLK